MPLDINSVREQFPMLQTTVYGKPLIYLDSAATTFKTTSVIDTVKKQYSSECSNIHRGIHYFSELGTTHYEQARVKVQNFINAKKAQEIIFTRGTTESINLLATSLSESFLNSGDEIIISLMEHHSNIVPWQMVAEKKNLKLKFINVTEDGVLDLEHFKTLLTDKTKIVSVTHISNVLGTINPIKDIIKLTHQAGAKCIIDAAQSVAHHHVDVQDLDADFLVFSGHKMYAPTGIGVLYGKEELLEELPPYQGGGSMIDLVTVEKTTYNNLPFKFEAGTPNIAGTLGLATAIDFIKDIGMDNIQQHEDMLFAYTLKKAEAIEDYNFYGPKENRSATFCFNHPEAHSSDIGMILDKRGFAIRTGHHCTQPLWQHFKLNGAARASFAIYNTTQEVDKLFTALEDIKDFF